MTIKEYIQSKSLNIQFTDMNIQSMLLTVSSVSDCIKDISTFDINDVNADIRTLTVKGQDLLVAEMYYLLSTTTSDSERVTADGVTVDKTNSFGVNDRKDFRVFGDALYAKWGLSEEDTNILFMRSQDRI